MRVFTGVRVVVGLDKVEVGIKIIDVAVLVMPEIGGLGFS
jgi:hypothetical protein